MSLPSSVLDAPYPETLLPSLAEKILGATDYLSISHDVLWLIEKTTGFNPLDKLAEWFVGDWRCYGVAASTLTQLQEYVGAVSNELHTGANNFAGDWMGNAGDDAVAFFDRAGITILDLLEPLADMNLGMKDLAYSIDATAGSLVGIAESIIDIGIELAIEAAAAAASSWTVIGPILAGGAAVISGARLVNKAREYINLYNKFTDVINGYLQLMSVWIGCVTKYVAPLKLTPYHHPGVN